MNVAASENETEKISSQQWLLLGLLVASICINYIDRANLSAAAEDLSKELSLDPKRVGLLLSSFFWTYMLCQIPAGWLIDKFNVYWVYAAGYFVWSAATALTGWADSFNTLLGLRLLLGVSESVAYPSYSKIICAGFPEEKRGLPNALIDAGSKLGPFLGVLIGGSIIAAYGWRVMFIAIGGASMLWLVPWSVAVRRGTGHAVREIREGPSILAIFKKGPAWGTFIGLMGSNYAWYFLLTWLPSYLRRERQFSAEMMATLGSIPYFAVAAASVFGGWLSDYLIRRGNSPTLVRKSFVVVGLLLATLLFPAALVRDPTIALILLTTACLSFGFFTSNVWAVTQSLAGTTAAGKWTGMQNTFGNISGIIAPYLTGWIVAETHSFIWGFAAACIALLISASSYILLVRRVEPIDWEVPSERKP
jgi:ACS family D-galactonate transporter-like MFS transporter